MLHTMATVLGAGILCCLMSGESRQHMASPYQLASSESGSPLRAAVAVGPW